MSDTEKDDEQIPHGTFVEVAGAGNGHFRDAIGIIYGTYADQFGGQNPHSAHHKYSIFKVQNGTVVDMISWFPKGSIVVMDFQDYGLALDMGREYLIPRILAYEDRYRSGKIPDFWKTKNLLDDVDKHGESHKD